MASQTTRTTPPLADLCFDVIIDNLDKYQNINEMLPIELKERIFAHYTSKITPNSSSSSFPIATYPEDRYRDVQLVNRITCQRVIPLCFAMWSSLDYRFEKVKRLIEEEACDVNESDLEGFCPLHYAAIYGRIEACKLLLSHGADCTRKNNFGKTPADLAQDACVQQMIKLRAALFRPEEMKALEADLAHKRKTQAEALRHHQRNEFLQQSKAIDNILQKRTKTSPSPSPSSSSPSSRSQVSPSSHFNVNSV